MEAIVGLVVVGVVSSSGRCRGSSTGLSLDGGDIFERDSVCPSAGAYVMRILRRC